VSGLGPSFMKIWHAEALREMGPEMPERGSFGIFSFRRETKDFLSGAIGDHGRNLVISL